MKSYVVDTCLGVGLAFSVKDSLPTARSITISAMSVAYSHNLLRLSRDVLMHRMVAGGRLVLRIRA